MKNPLLRLSSAATAIHLASAVRVAIVACAMLTGTHASRAAEYFVSPTGSDGSAGTQARPFKTIQKAADVAKAGDTITVRAGTYRETVRPAHDGRAGAPITFRPFKNEIVTVSGADVVRGFQLTAGGDFQAPMRADFFASQIHQSDQVFVDGRMMTQARWPNTGFDVSRPAKAQITKFISKTEDKATHWWTAVFEDDHLQPQTDGYYDGAEVYVQPDRGAWSWTLSGRVVHQTGNRLTIQTRNGGGKDGQQDVYAVGSRYYLFNKRELLDAPGEWFHDTAAGTLTLRSPDGTPADGPHRGGQAARLRLRPDGPPLHHRPGPPPVRLHPDHGQHVGRRRRAIQPRRHDALPLAARRLGGAGQSHRRGRAGRPVRQPLHRRLRPLLSAVADGDGDRDRRLGQRHPQLPRAVQRRQRHLAPGPAPPVPQQPGPGHGLPVGGLRGHQHGHVRDDPRRRDRPQHRPAHGPHGITLRSLCRTRTRPVSSPASTTTTSPTS